MDSQRRAYTQRLLRQFVIHAGLTFMMYLVDVPNDGACFFTCLAYYASYCENHSIIKSQILKTDPDENRQLLCNFLQANRDSIMITDSDNLLTVHQYFLAIYGPNAFERKTVHISNASHDQIFCNTFEQYIEYMRNPVAHADEIFVWAASQMFNIQLSILEKFVRRIDDPNVKYLVDMGYSEVDAQNALEKCSKNLQEAVDFLLQNPPSSESSDVWRENVHNEAGTFECKIVRTGRHFQLLLPQYVPKKDELKLPPVAAQEMWQYAVPVPSDCPRVDLKGKPLRSPPLPPPQKPSAGGGGAARSSQKPDHIPPRSFGHTQLDLNDLFVKPFAELVIYTGRPATEDDIRKKLVFITGMAQDAEARGITGAFFGMTPNLSAVDIRKIHCVVGSMFVNGVKLRATAFVFSDGHVVSSHNIKSVTDASILKEMKRLFLAELQTYADQHPRMNIQYALFEPCT